MYGMLLESVQHFVRAEFGESLWQAALSDLGMRNCVFSTHRTYPDDSMTRLAQACATRVTGWSADSFLFFFGRCFVRFFSHYGYDQLIRASGRHLRDFLRGVDNLHHQIRFSYPRMRSPSMQLREEHRLGALLHYQSDRTGLHFYVVGQLVQVAKGFYGMHLVVGAVTSRSSRHVQVTQKSWSADSFLFFFGRCFVRFFSHYGYDQLIRASGRHLRDFLRGVDNLHHQIRFSYPRMRSPSMQLREEHRLGALLHYQSDRTGLHFYVVGQLVQVAKSFYGMHLVVNVLSVQSTSEGSLAVLQLNFDNAAFEASELRRLSVQGRVALADVGWASLQRVVPFGLAMDRRLELAWIGPRLRLVCGTSRAQLGTPVGELFRLHRPAVPFTWDSVISIQEVVVELECLGPSDSDVEREGRQLLLKGQMRYLKESDVILFLGVPLLSGLQELQDAGLYLEDLCMHDMTRDIVLAGWQHGANLEVSYKEQERKTQNLEENLVRLDEWRKRGDDLLYSMLPKSVADSLRQGADPVNTCQSFDSVTVLFSELVNFPAACRHLSPMQVVSWVNATFSLFDVITDRYGVFKVETVGHVYMLVSGAPERRPDHADQVCAAALEMLSALQGTGQPFHEHGTHLRAGIHSGPVAAGVVGMKTLRYCLFGDTVNTAARMQTHGQVKLLLVQDKMSRHPSTA
ncbi:hypothetical protein HPB47_008753 [Ixodes persulcatus]|uniref:Uncharacterized protein n=1 Tax=Ixodes persulcatus TaxID=34615 RepID=A0AC60P3W9_IXOPE|nr:hypothetical protein HPB47_008753 [Ixodes persulcatus]